MKRDISFHDIFFRDLWIGHLFVNFRKEKCEGMRKMPVLSSGVSMIEQQKDPRKMQNE